MSFTSQNNLYGFPQPLSRVFPPPVIAKRIPTSADYKYPLGTLWVDEVEEAYYGLVNVTSATATWIDFGSASGYIATITGDDSVAVSPNAGNFYLNGTANQITTTSESNGEVFSLSATLIAPGTLASTTTLTAGSTLTVTTSATIGTTLGVTGATTLAALTQTGTTNINTSGSAVTTLGTGGTGAVHIGNATGNTAVTGSLTASTSLTATSGNITATLGNFVATNGNLTLNTLGNYIGIKHGTTGMCGTCTLSSGTVQVNNTNIATGDFIFFTNTNTNSSTALGNYTYTISNAASFTVTAVEPGTPASTQTGDTSILAYLIIRPL
jgi:hypothetical protein